jgi:hypothetical protein
MTARTLIMRNDQVGGQRLDVPDRGEQILNFIKVFSKNTDVVSFFETTGFMRVMGQWQNKKIDDKIMVYRSSFLPGSFFSQAFVPVISGVQKSPGLMIDNSLIFSSSILVYSLDGSGKLVSPAARTISLPKNCAGRSPVLSSNGYSRLPFVCDDGTSVQLRLVDLK